MVGGNRVSQCRPRRSHRTATGVQTVFYWLGWLPLLGLVSQLAPSASHAQSPTSVSPPTARLSFKARDEQRDELGEVLLESQDGGKLFLTADGQMWLLQPQDIRSQAPSTELLKPHTTDEVAAELRGKLPAGFLVHKTAHFILVYNTSETYARWVGDLFERLYRAMMNFWDSRGFKLHDPRFPMVALVLDSQDAYMQFGQKEIGKQASDMIGYYYMETNRVVMFDITGLQGLAAPGQRYSSTAMLTQLFSQPQAERTVATVVHEAVHQIAYNCGLQTRLADNPRWVSEGLAMFFESPDVNNPKGWGTIGKVNRYQLQQFRSYLANRPNDSLTTLISDERRWTNAATRTGVVAESWALTYYLMKAKSDEFVAYLKELALLPPLGETDSRQRIELFRKHFGEDLNKLDAQFIAFMRRQR